MTKSTITREESIQAVFDLKVGYTLGLADIEILKRVARMALASMDGEPVEVKGSDELYDVIDDDDNVVLSAVSYNEAQTESDGYNGENLYIVRHEAQPAPVVPDGLRLALSNAGIAAPESDEMLAATCEKHIQALVTWVKDRKPFQSAPVVPTFDEWLEISGNKPLGWVKDAMRESYDACRADMLAAAPHDTPALNSVQSVVTAQGKWIPVSEQMPENKPGCYEYLVFETLNNRVNHDYWNAPDKGDDAFTPFWNYYGEHVTHWMTLPAAPQEVK
ncbi:DUF551 domain-containing protein [Klebsiella quasipneumoniae]|uniref:DUF551 domain-containing protein n=1 Tax=Klebsiella quasipneumoniae TaxID=1463165 RepID=UPI0038D0F3BC